MTGKVRSAEPLKNVYLNGKITDPSPTKIEMMIPKIPVNLDLHIFAENDITLNFSANEGVRFLFLNVSREFENRWFSGTLIAHDIPSDLEIAFRADTRYTKETPLVGMPNMKVKASSDTMDIYMKMQGRVFARRGNYMVFAEDLSSGLSAYLEDETYKIRANNPKNFILIVDDMPLMPEYELRSLKLFVKDLKSVDIKMFMIGDMLPAVMLKNTDVGDLKLSLSHEMDVLGIKISPGVVLSETAFTETESPALLIPFKSPTHINQLSTSLSSGRTTVIFPNIFATIVVTFAPLFIILLVILLFLFIGVRMYKKDNEGEEEGPEPKKKKRKKWGKGKKIFVMIILLIILASLLFYLFVPRVQLSVKTDFIETPSGIFVVCETSNSGTVPIKDLNVTFQVLNATDAIINSTMFSAYVLERGDQTGGYVHYFGNQFESYTILVTVHFYSYGQEFQRTFSYLAKDYMRISFEDNVS
jgi:cell division protein FtsL